jgi:hypothetical protein
MAPSNNYYQTDIAKIISRQYIQFEAEGILTPYRCRVDILEVPQLIGDVQMQPSSGQSDRLKSRVCGLSLVFFSPQRGRAKELAIKPTRPDCSVNHSGSFAGACSTNA